MLCIETTMDHGAKKSVCPPSAEQDPWRPPSSGPDEGPTYLALGKALANYYLHLFTVKCNRRRELQPEDRITLSG